MKIFFGFFVACCFFALAHSADADSDYYGYSDVAVYLDYRDNSLVAVNTVPSGGFSFDSGTRTGQVLVSPKAGVNVLFPSQVEEYDVVYASGTQQSPVLLPVDAACFSLRPTNEQGGALRLDVEYNHFNSFPEAMNPDEGALYNYRACQSCGRNYFLRIHFELTDDPVGYVYYLSIPFSIPCAADVTLVTRREYVGIDELAVPASIGGMKVSLADAIESYIVHLRDKGSTVRYVELDHGDAQTSFDFNDPSLSPSMSSAAASKSLVPAVRKVLQKTQSSYLVILGGVSVIPMPFHSDEEGANGQTYLVSRDGKVPSDDPYAMRADGQVPEVIVARFPSVLDYSDTITRMMMSGLSASPIPTDFTSVLVVGDACGSADHCFIRENLEDLSQTLFGRSCEEEGETTGRCRLAPTFCKYIRIGSQRMEAGCSTPPPIEQVKYKGGLVFLLHGSGASFGAASPTSPIMSGVFGGETESYNVVLESTDLNNFEFASAPAIFSVSCYGSAIDSSLVPTAMPELAVIGLARAGARAVIGHTRVGFGDGPLYFDLIKNFFTSRSKTLGQRFKELKQAGYTWREAQVDNTLQQLRSQQATFDTQSRWTQTIRDLYLEGDNWEETIPSMAPAAYWPCFSSFFEPEAAHRACVREKLTDTIAALNSQSASVQNEIKEIEANRRLALTTAQKQVFSDVETLVLYGDPTQTSAG